VAGGGAGAAANLCHWVSVFVRSRKPGYAALLRRISSGLVDIHPAAIVAAQLPAALAAKAATDTVPLVFTAGDDPVKMGLVAAINRPGGNATGVNPIVTSLDDKRLALLKELVPSAKHIAVLMNPNLPDVSSHIAKLQAASRLIEVELSVVYASKESEFGQAFASFDQRKPSACWSALILYSRSRSRA
jgi:putative tryptophan/tyrosine transport system substrate-binding protein